MAESTLLISGGSCKANVTTHTVKAAELEFDRASMATIKDGQKVRQAS